MVPLAMAASHWSEGCPSPSSTIDNTTVEEVTSSQSGGQPLLHGDGGHNLWACPPSRCLAARVVLLSLLPELATSLDLQGTTTTSHVQSASSNASATYTTNKRKIKLLKKIHHRRMSRVQR